jgi:hypothetical protein
MEKVFRVFRFDIVTCRRSMATLFASFFLFGLYYGLAISNLLAIPVSVMIWVAMIAGLPYVLRDKYGLDKLLATFPLNRKTIIRGRFLLSLVIGIMGIAMSEIMVCLSAGIFRIGFDIREMYFVLCLSFLLYCLVITVHMPLYFRFPNTQVIQMSPMLVYFSYIIATHLYYAGLFHVDLEPAVSIAWRFSALTLFATLLLAALILYASYAISCKVYINKDL